MTHEMHPLSSVDMLNWQTLPHRWRESPAA